MLAHDPASAKSKFDEARRLDPSDWVAWNNLGSAATALGLMEEE